MSESEAITRHVRVHVSARYVPGQSQPFQNQWYFSYTVEIANEGPETVQLISRHWIVTDANGTIDEAKGPGVVGQQPVLEPGDSFEYTSHWPLKTSSGTMHGTFQMITGEGEQFDVEIAPFVLSEPYTVH